MKNSSEVIPRRMPHHSPSSGTSSAGEKGYVGPIQDRRIPETLDDIHLGLEQIEVVYF